MGFPPWLGACAPMGGCATGACLGLLEETVGLNVTVLCGRTGTGRGPAEACDMEEISGVVSVELEAILGARSRAGAIQLADSNELMSLNNGHIKERGHRQCKGLVLLCFSLWFWKLRCGAGICLDDVLSRARTLLIHVVEPNGQGQRTVTLSCSM